MSTHCSEPSVVRIRRRLLAFLSVMTACLMITGTPVSAQYSGNGFTASGYIRDNTLPIVNCVGTPGPGQVVCTPPTLMAPVCELGPSSSCAIQIAPNSKPYVNQLSASIAASADAGGLRAALTYSLQDQIAGSFVGQFLPGVSFRSPPIVAQVEVTRTRSFTPSNPTATFVEFVYQVTGTAAEGIERRGRDICGVLTNGVPDCPDGDNALSPLFHYNGGGRFNANSSSVGWGSFTSNQFTFNTNQFVTVGSMREERLRGTLSLGGLPSFDLSETFGLTLYLQDCYLDPRDESGCVRALLDPYNFNFDANFASTVALTQALLYDQNGAFLPDARLIDADGVVISNGVSQVPVPEPASAVLLTVATVVLLAKRRRTRI